MTAEHACEMILDEGDHLHRMPRHGSATPLSKRDCIRGRLLLTIARDAVDRADVRGTRGA